MDNIPQPEFKDILSPLVLEEHSREQAERIAKLLNENPTALSTAVWLLHNGQPPLPQRISWPLEIACSSDPESFAPYAGSLIEWLPHFKHPAEFRNVTKLLKYAPIPDHKVGELFDLAFSWIIDPKILPATRANCMDIAFRICGQEPDLLREVALAIREAMRHGGPAIKARGKQVLKQIEKVRSRL